jgi:hypothetical protein
MKCYEVSRNDLRRNFAKFRLNPFREISCNFTKFRETGKQFRLVSCFAKRGKPNFVATLLLWSPRPDSVKHTTSPRPRHSHSCLPHYLPCRSAPEKLLSQTKPWRFGLHTVSHTTTSSPMPPPGTPDCLPEDQTVSWDNTLSPGTPDVY